MPIKEMIKRFFDTPKLRTRILELESENRVLRYELENERKVSGAAEKLLNVARAPA